MDSQKVVGRTMHGTIPEKCKSKTNRFPLNRKRSIWDSARRLVKGPAQDILSQASSFRLSWLCFSACVYNFRAVVFMPCSSIVIGLKVVTQLPNPEINNHEISLSSRKPKSLILPTIIVFRLGEADQNPIRIFKECPCRADFQTCFYSFLWGPETLRETMRGIRYE